MSLYLVFSEFMNKDGFAKAKQAHFDYLSGLQEKGVLVAAGPFTDMSAAVYVLRADSLKEAEEAAAGDPIHVHKVRKFWVKEWKIVRLWKFTAHDLP